MSELCTDIGFVSANKYGEQLCGDHVERIDQENGVTVVLADGLGSGVKANILSTLTSKILSTMIAGGLTVEDCVKTIAATLPVCEVRKVAYSTFTIIHIVENREAELIQYDNPRVILLRGGRSVDYPQQELTIDGKRILKSVVPLEEGDVFMAMSDGAIHAGVGLSLNFGWQREEIASFLETVYDGSFTAKTLAAMLVGECTRLYGNKPGDDTTACAVRIRRRKTVNLMIGPPADPARLAEMHQAFSGSAGRHIVCGGTTSTLAAEYLHKPLDTSLPLYLDPEIPPTARIEGVDLVTEGVITFSRVLEYANDYLKDNERYTDWSYKKDGASQIARMLFEEATDVNFFVGRAVNPAHQNPDLPIGFNIKMQLVEGVAKALTEMGKRVAVTYY